MSVRCAPWGLRSYISNSHNSLTALSCREVRCRNGGNASAARALTMPLYTRRRSACRVSRSLDICARCLNWEAKPETKTYLRPSPEEGPITMNSASAARRTAEEVALVHISPRAPRAAALRARNQRKPGPARRRAPGTQCQNPEAMLGTDICFCGPVLRRLGGADGVEDGREVGERARGL